MKAAWKACLAALAAAWGLACAAQGYSAAALRQLYTQPPQDWPAPWVDAGIAFTELAPAPLPPPPATDAERRRAALGARLFVERRLSASGTVSCADCHRPHQGWTVHTPLAWGHAGQPGRRNPPALYTAAARSHWGWDGAGASLAARALAPLTDPAEMGLPHLDDAVARALASPALAAALREAAPPGARPAEALGPALAAYLRTLDAPTRLDRFLCGDAAALSDAEIHGLHLFRTRARCINCHHGPLLADGRFHNLGLSSFGERSQDLGRHAVTGRCADVGAFRTPSLRHVAQTAPYMHHGLLRTLEGVVHFYARGGGEVRARNAREAAHPLFPCAAAKSPHLRPLALTPDEQAALAAFLRAL